MKLIKLMPFMAMLIFIGCDNSSREADDADEMLAEEVTMRDPAEVNKEWEDAWNQNDPQKLESMTADDAVLFMSGEINESDSLSSWYKMVAPDMKDLKTTTESKGQGKDFAYMAGTFSHGSKQDSTEHYQGTYTFIWERDSTDWKIKVMSINDKVADSSAVENE